MDKRASGEPKLRRTEDVYELDSVEAFSVVEASRNNATSEDNRGASSMTLWGDRF